MISLSQSPPAQLSTSGSVRPKSPSASIQGRTITLKRDVLLAKYFALESKAGIGASVGRDGAGRPIVVDLKPEGAAYKSNQEPRPHPCSPPFRRA